MFGNANNAATPTVATAMTDAPWLGAWCDLNPGGPGSGPIVVTSPGPNLLRVDWMGVSYFLIPSMTVTWNILLDGSTGGITLDGLMGWPPFPNAQGSLPEMLGISAGSLGATDPGMTAFTTGGPNPGPAGLGMIYETGQAGTLAPGVNTLTFYPNASGNYDWTGA
jgi:hypothetical protein